MIDDESLNQTLRRFQFQSKLLLQRCENHGAECVDRGVRMLGTGRLGEFGVMQCEIEIAGKACLVQNWAINPPGKRIRKACLRDSYST
jgi:hypothetical protein